MMNDIRDCEDKVTYARTRYNMSVSTYNQVIVVFPDSIVAGMIGCTPEKMFEIAETARAEADDLRIGNLK